MICTGVKKSELFYWKQYQLLNVRPQPCKTRKFLAHTGKNFSLCTLQQGHRCWTPRRPPGPVVRVYPKERKNKGEVDEAINRWGVSKVEKKKAHTRPESCSTPLFACFVIDTSPSQVLPDASAAHSQQNTCMLCACCRNKCLKVQI